MHKLLIAMGALASLGLAGCSTIGDAIPNALDNLPLVYRPTIQQGNVVTQEQIDALKPGMSRSQVRFIMGTPMLVDVFHQDRWDYTYTRGVGSRIEEIRRTTLYFEGDRLARITGDLRPNPEAAQRPVKKAVVVSVPDWKEGGRSFWGRTLDTIGLGDEE